MVSWAAAVVATVVSIVALVVLVAYVTMPGLSSAVYRLLFLRGQRRPGVLTGLVFPIALEAWLVAAFRTVLSQLAQVVRVELA